MPNVNGKKFPYTSAGMAAAKKAGVKKPADKMMRGPKPPPKGKPGMVYTGGSRDFDEKTGKYRSGKVPVKPGRITGGPVPPGKKLPSKPGRVSIPTPSRKIPGKPVIKQRQINRRGM